MRKRHNGYKDFSGFLIEYREFPIGVFHQSSFLYSITQDSQRRALGITYMVTVSEIRKETNHDAGRKECCCE